MVLTLADQIADLRRDAKCTRQRAEQLREDSVKARQRADRLWIDAEAEFKRAAALRNEVRELRQRQGF